MSWRDQLRPASFRGVPFKVESADTAFGRRNAVHEYPFKDQPYTEDLGRKAREISIRAYVLGEDHLAAQDALIKAIENEKTPGTLVHPTLGTLSVVPKDCRHGYSNKEGGIAYFDLNFVEAGRNNFPDQTVDTKAGVNTAADKALETIQSVFGNVFNVSNLPAFVSSSAQTILSDAATRIRNAVANKTTLAEETAALLGDLSTFESNIATYVETPASLASEVSALVAQVRTAFSSANDAYAAFKAMLDFGDDLFPVPETTTTRKQQANNQRQLVGLFKRSALAGMANTIVDLAFESYEDAVSTRDALADSLDDELLVIGDTDEDQAYLDLEGLRAAVVKDVTDRAANLRRVKYLNLTKCLPAVVTSYDVYETAENAAEIVARNKVRHPGFLPANQPLQVLV